MPTSVSVFTTGFICLLLYLAIDRRVAVSILWQPSMCYTKGDIPSKPTGLILKVVEDCFQCLIPC
jgi:hypothetical protein